MRKVQRVKNFAIYDENDSYVSGFDTLKECAEYIGYGNSNELDHLVYVQKDNFEEYKFFNEEEQVWECSKKIVEYQRSFIKNGKVILPRGVSIYKFWIEEI